jgi:hypothetical protein
MKAIQSPSRFPVSSRSSVPFTRCLLCSFGWYHAKGFVEGTVRPVHGGDGDTEIETKYSQGEGRISKQPKKSVLICR